MGDFEACEPFFSICLALQDVAANRTRHLLIEEPPDLPFLTGRLVGSVWPAWLWLLNPALRVLSTSCSLNLAARHVQMAGELMREPWFQKTFEPAWQLSAQNKSHFALTNSERGMLRASHLGAALCGFRCNGIVIDTPWPVDAGEVAIKEAAYELRALSNRLADPRSGWIVMVVPEGEMERTRSVLNRTGFPHYWDTPPVRMKVGRFSSPVVGAG